MASLVLIGAALVSPAPAAGASPEAIPSLLGASASSTVTVDATHPDGVINQQLLGADGPGPAGATSEMAKLGLGWVRTDVGFEGTDGAKPVYNCTTGAWDPDPLDAKVGQIRAEGAAPMLIVDYTPPCLAPLSLPSPADTSYEPPDLGGNELVWDALVYRMAIHEIIAEGVRAFEIWNEPDGTFWYGGLPGYLLLYQDTATVLEQAAAATGTHIAVGGPALFFSDPTWIEPFLAFVALNHLPLDFLSWHWYANYPLFGPLGPIPMFPAGFPPLWYSPALEPATYGLEVAQVRAELATFPSLHPRLWIDEWNVDAGYDARQSGPYDAAFAAAVLQDVQMAGLDRMSFFDVADTPGDLRGNWGMLTTAMAPKPVYQSFLYWHEMAPDLVPTDVRSEPSIAALFAQVGAMASIGSGGRVTLLAYNFVPFDVTGGNGASDPTPFDQNLVVDVQGLAPGPYTWTRDLVDGSHIGGQVGSGSVSGPNAQVGFTLAGDGVTLITFSPRQT
ncbi:MAG: GH39 family glycosyl hydrolase [Acidimicrobiales bacterium]